MGYFFMSYARADSADGRFARFVRDLSDELARLDPDITPQDAGFFDTRSIEVGDPWPWSLVNGLRTCKVFLAAYSPNYFASEYCGREWAFFKARLDRYARARNRPAPPLIIPVLWMPPPELPPAATDLQYTHADLGEAYAKEGLLYLMRLKRCEDEYQETLVRLGRRLIEVANRFPLPPLQDSPDIRSIRPSFAGEPVPTPHPTTTAEPGPRGPRHVRFVIAAAQSGEMNALRQDCAPYGASHLDWQPYRPLVEDRVAVTAQRIAIKRELSSELVPVDGNLTAMLEEARSTNDLVVFIVDPWTVCLEAYRERLREYDKRNFPNSGVIVTWNEADEETTVLEPMLGDEMWRAFENNLQRGDAAFRTRVGHAQFERTLETILTASQKRVFENGRVRRATPAARVIQKPTVTST